MKFYFKIIASLFLFLLCLPAISQHIPFNKFVIEGADKQPLINVVFIKNNGYLLAGTSGGLYKFDGLKFIPVPFQNPDFSDAVSAIHEDAMGKMWIGFESGRIANIINDRLVYWNPEEGTPKQKITRILSGKNKELFFSTSGEGVYISNENRVYLIDESNGLAEKTINDITLTDNNELIAATDQGLAVITGNDNKVKKTIGPSDGLPDYIVTSIEPAGNNKFWLGMQEKGFCLYDHSSGKVTVFPVEWNYGAVNSMHASESSLLIATTGNGMLKFNLKDNSLKKLQLSNEVNISSIAEDDFGNTFYATNNALIQFRNESIRIYPLPSETVFDHIHTLLKDNNDRFWLTNQENEILIYDETLSLVQKKIKLPGITAKTDITSFYQDDNGRVWAGTVGRGMFTIDPVTFSVTDFNHVQDFRDRTILSIGGKNNKVFVSSLEGAFYIDLLQAKREGRFNFLDYKIRNTANSYVYAIYENKKGETWFATDGNGLIGLSNNVYNVYGKPELKDDRIYSLTEDLNGNLWFSTARAGIYRYDGKSFKNYGMQQGLTELNISSLKCDKAGNILILHKKGVDVLDTHTGNIFHLNENSGIGNINTEDLDAATIDRNGNVLVCTRQGIAEFSFQSAIPSQPRTLIENVQLFLNRLDDEHDNRFSHDDNNLTFNYTGLYYSDAEQVHYQYMLEGFDTSWINTSDRSKTFAKLLPGKYNFRVRSSNNKYFINSSEASYSFTIRSPFYKTWWFILLSLSALSAGIILLVRYREKSLRKMERLQREQIQFRFEVLRNQVNPHFLFNSFNTLISIIDEDPQKAIQYVEQLSDFFRDIVKYRDDETISLEEELALLKNYFYLQQKRFGENIRLNNNIPVKAMQARIPPLTLQLLAENALKHNVISRNNPLVIDITADENHITVSNNITMKKSNEKSSGMGLQNIISRYKFLSGKEVRIVNDSENFIVILPILSKDAHTNH